jgi:hypothetical protein
MRLIEWYDAVAEHARMQYALGNLAETRVAIDRVRSRFASDSVAVNGSFRLGSLQLLEARVQAAQGQRDSALATATRARGVLQVAAGAAHPLTRAAAAFGSSLRMTVRAAR